MLLCNCRKRETENVQEACCQTQTCRVHLFCKGYTQVTGAEVTCFTLHRHSLGEIRFKTKLDTKQMSLFNFVWLCVLLWSLARSWPHHTIPANITLAVKRLFHLLSKSILAFFWNLPREPARGPKTHFQKTYCMCLLPRKQSEVAFISAQPNVIFFVFRQPVYEKLHWGLSHCFVWGAAAPFIT